MEKNSIYDWNDLRKAPEYLPPVRGAYVVVVKYDEWTPDIGIAWWTGETWRDCFVFDSADGFSGQPNLCHPEVSIIAWKRIERFEEAGR